MRLSLFYEAMRNSGRVLQLNGVNQPIASSIWSKYSKWKKRKRELEKELGIFRSKVDSKSNIKLTPEDKWQKEKKLQVARDTLQQIEDTYHLKSSKLSNEHRFIINPDYK